MTDHAPDALPRAPRGLPARLIDALVVLAAALFWAGVLAEAVVLFSDEPGRGQVIDQSWSSRSVVAAALLPAVLALAWRRRHPIAVLGVALAVTVAAFPYSALMGAFALFAAASRLTAARAGVACLLSIGCIFGGQAIWIGAPDWGDVGFLVVGTAVVTALGLYAGARRDYYDRLRERALFARALASFLPTGVSELIEASPQALSLEQELDATVLFSDIRGFSTVAEQLSPRDVASVIGRHAAAMAELVGLHGGIVDKFAGDGVMAVFGAPRPMPGDADRAIACAVAMQHRQAELNAEAPGLGHPTTEIGIGINTGRVIAGTLGGAGRFDYTVIGDAVNVAQRLQSEAGPGEILVSAATLEASTRSSVEPAGARQLKGRSEPVDVYRVVWEAAGDERATSSGIVTKSKPPGT